MTAWRIIVRSLVYYWRINLAVALGVAAATAVLTGALLVGDSVRGSLKHLTLQRLGAIDHILVADRFFRVELADELAADPNFDTYFTTALPAIVFPTGTVERMGEVGQAATQRAARVLVIGTPPEFWDLGAADGRPGTRPGRNQIVLNTPLADELGAKVGDLIALRLPKTNQVHAESALGEKANRIRGIARLEVVAIVPAKGLGRFSLESRQTTPRNAYVSLDTLQRPLDQDGRVNCLLVAGQPPIDRVDPAANQALAAMFKPRLEDYGYRVKRVRSTFAAEAGSEPSAEADAQPGDVVFDYYSLSSDRMLFTPSVAQVASEAYEDFGTQPVLTYLANAIGVVGEAKTEKTDKTETTESTESTEDAATTDDTDDTDNTDDTDDTDDTGGEKSTPGPAYDEESEIPYSTVAAITEQTAARILRSADGDLPPLDHDGIVLNSWAAENLKAEVGDTIRLKYFEPETADGQAVERSADFTLRGIVALTEPAKPYTPRRAAVYDSRPTAVNDPDLTPDVEGVTDRDSIESWDVPFPMTRVIRPIDDEYWKNHRTTPKAFVSLERGQELWGTDRFGRVTSFRIPAERVNDQQQLAERFIERAKSERVELGLIFQPMKQHALAASAGTTPFDGLFLGLSLFIIAAALMLVALLFRLGVEQRAREVGILLAVGLRRRQAAYLLVVEGTLVAALGGVLGVAAGVAYSQLMLLGLTQWWLGAIVTPFLQFHWHVSTLVLGYALGVLICAVTILVSVRQLRKFTSCQLLAGQTHEAGGLVRGSQLAPRLVAAVMILLTVVLAIAAMFVGGETQAGCFVGSGASLLTALLLIIWTRLRSATSGGAALGAFATFRLAARSASRNPGRSTLTIGLLGSASFLIVSMSSFRMAPTESGVGGFNLLAESGQPVFENLDSQAGRERLLGKQADKLRDVTILPMRLRAGDDASCNNMYRPSQPRVLGVGEAVMDYFDDPSGPPFQWAATDAKSEAENINPWRMLERDADDGVVPVILDNDTAMWSLQLYWGVGEEFDVTYDDGKNVRFRVVGLLSKSVLQGSLLIGERHFVEAFPNVAGDRFFLIRSSPQREAEVVTVLESGISDRGFDVTSSYTTLEGLLAVQNTYLSTFQSLGALGLLLGTLGLATVQLRSVLERRGELALLRTIGFRRSRLARLVLLENILLLFAGLATGVIAALVAVLPHMLAGTASIPWSLLGSLGLTLAVVLAVGILSGLAAVRATLRAPLLEALREE